MSAPRLELLACFALAACSGQAETLMTVAPDSAHPVQFSVDVWPGEGIPVIETKRAVLRLRAAPDPESPVVDSIHGRVGQRLLFDSTRVQTIRSGSLRAVQPLRVVGRDMGESSHLTLARYYASDQAVSIPVLAPGTIEYLQYRAEGTCFVRINRRVIDAEPCPGWGRESVELVAHPATRWWIRVRGQGGSHGWLLVSDSTAQSVRREF